MKAKSQNVLVIEVLRVSYRLPQWSSNTSFLFSWWSDAEVGEIQYVSVHVRVKSLLAVFSAICCNPVWMQEKHGQPLKFVKTKRFTLFQKSLLKKKKTLNTDLSKQNKNKVPT